MRKALLTTTHPISHPQVRLNVIQHSLRSQFCRRTQTWKTVLKKKWKQHTTT